MTPPPPPPSAAASLSVLAGNGQTVSAGEPAPIAPAVVVRDNVGSPLAGVTVQFTVTAGGGTLTGATPVSDATGIARVTSWTVGGSGVQRVAASVGTLTPVTIEATIDPVTVAMEQVIPANGGEVSITTAGHPYQGLTLTIPAGTFPATVTWSMRVRPSATPPAMPAGYRVGGPMLEIATDAPRGNALMTLEVPVHPQPGEGVVLVFHDPLRNVMEVLPTIARTAATIRVVTKHLRPDLLLGPPPAASFLARSAPASAT